MLGYLIAVDAGFAGTGISVWAITDSKKMKFVDCYSIITKSERSIKKHIYVSDLDVERMKQLLDGINGFVKKYEGEKVIVGIELPTGASRGSRPNRTMGIATGLIYTYFYFKFPISIVTPNDVKKIMGGKINTSKEYIMNKAGKILKMKYGKGNRFNKSEFEHIADSVGVAMHMKKKDAMFQIFLQSL